VKPTAVETLAYCARWNIPVNSAQVKDARRHAARWSGAWDATPHDHVSIQIKTLGLLAASQSAHGTTRPDIQQSLQIERKPVTALAIRRAGLAIVIALHVAGGCGLPKPDLQAWLKQNQPAIASPRLAQALRAQR
jgi:hypothetical protein